MCSRGMRLAWPGERSYTPCWRARLSDVASSAVSVLSSSGAKGPGRSSTLAGCIHEGAAHGHPRQREVARRADIDARRCLTKATVLLSLAALLARKPLLLFLF